MKKVLALGIILLGMSFGMYQRATYWGQTTMNYTLAASTVTLNMPYAAGTYEIENRDATNTLTVKHYHGVNSGTYVLAPLVHRDNYPLIQYYGEQVVVTGTGAFYINFYDNSER